MGKRNQQRRAEKRRAEARRPPGRPQRRGDGRTDGTGDRGDRPSPRPVRELLVSAAIPAMVGAEAAVAPVVAEILERHERDPAGVAEAVLDELRRGWQPADLAHSARRKLDAGGVAVLAAAIAIQGETYRHGPGADGAWLAQVDAVASAGPPPTGDREALAYLADLAGGLAAAVTGAAATLGLLRLAPSLPHLVEPPSAWGRRPATSARRVGVGPTGRLESG